MAIKLNVERMYKRFSEISGVPLAQLKPKIANDFRNSGNKGEYRANTHTITLRSQTPFVLDHELQHGIQINENILNSRLSKILERNIIQSKTKKEIFQKDHDKSYKFYEPTADVFTSGLLQKSHKQNFAEREMRAHSGKVPFLTNPSWIIQIIRNLNVKRLVKKHGVDGLFLLYVAPPKKLDALEIPKWRKEMVSKGYLKEKGGLTKRGLSFWRQNLQPESVWRFLADAQLNREARERGNKNKRQ
ncbi:hypothetical protein HY989_02850 [Candidatus Micrarchaeota archaeon]|nr:hypothetical protein [Candidatus Micrarchaeota archaeon]